MILVPLIDLKSLRRVRSGWCRDFKSAALVRPHHRIRRKPRKQQEPRVAVRFEQAVAQRSVVDANRAQLPDEVHGERGYQIVLDYADTPELQQQCLDLVQAGAEMRFSYTRSLYDTYVAPEREPVAAGT